MCREEGSRSELKIGEEIVEEVEEFKYLGEWVDGSYEVMFS